MTKQQIALLAALGLAVLCVLSLGAYIVISKESDYRQAIAPQVSTPKPAVIESPTWTPTPEDTPAPTDTPVPPPTPNSPPKLTPKPCSESQPAHAYCMELGYKCKVRTREDGGETGVCIFPDGTECEAWSFFRGNCAQEKTCCGQQGFRIENRIDDMGTWTAEYAVCVFPDGSECLEQDYLAGECSPSFTVPLPYPPVSASPWPCATGRRSESNFLTILRSSLEGQ